jgi:hypothetical protein
MGRVTRFGQKGAAGLWLTLGRKRHDPMKNFEKVIFSFNE